MGLMDKANAYNEAHKFDCSFDDLVIIKDQLRRGLSSTPPSECSAEIGTGPEIAARVTATRVVAGTLVFGPLGGVIGALSKKSAKDMHYMVVKIGDDIRTYDVPPKKFAKAQTFAAKLNAAAKQNSPRA